MEQSDCSKCVKCNRLLWESGKQIFCLNNHCLRYGLITAIVNPAMEQTKTCVICGKALIRRKGESYPRFAKRKTEKYCRTEYMRRNQLGFYKKGGE